MTDESEGAIAWLYDEREIDIVGSAPDERRIAIDIAWGHATVGHRISAARARTLAADLLELADYVERGDA